MKALVVISRYITHFNVKTYKHLFDSMVQPENISAAIDKAAEHKHKRRDVKEVLKHKGKYVKIVQDMLLNDEFKPPEYKLHKIKEGSKKKTRYIEKPYFKYDQIVQHVLITQLKPIIMKSLHPQAYGSLEDRGMLQIAKRISKWLKNDPKGTRYCLQMDIHHCYPSVDKEILIQKYHRIIKDERFNKVNDAVIKAFPIGISLGAPTSVWHIHFLLTEFDHYISSLDNVKHYARFMDDIIIFGSNKRKLHRVEENAINFLKEKLNLEVNHSHQVFPIEWQDKKGKIHGRPLDVCGYLFYRNKRILRKTRMLGITKKARKLKKKKKLTHYDAQQMLSQMSWLKHSDTYDMYLEHVEPYVKKRTLRRIISRVTRKKRMAELRVA